MSLKKDFSGYDPEEFGVSVEMVGGSSDGLKFTWNHEAQGFTCNQKQGLFKQVFVPIDFNHEAIVK